jgi:hypothetical protein
MESLVRHRKAGSGWLKALPVGLLLLLGHADVRAQMNTFDVGSGVPADNINPLINYSPFINATNFSNDTGSTFSWSLGSSGTWLGSLYQGWFYTLNFTNAGEMDSSTGFRFDTQIPNVSGHTEAVNFYNVGPINCGTSDNAVFLTQFTSGFFSFGGYGGAYVLATNIFNSGTITVGANGLARFIGDNINFNRGSVVIQNQSFSGGSGANISASGAVDASTNKWSPAGALQQNYAYGPMNKTPFGLYLNNSAPYFNIITNGNGTNVVVQMVFLQDNSVNVATNVYFGSFGGNNAVVEWVGSYTDPATGLPASRYLYLNDYFGQINTNLLTFGDPGSGIPNNYSLFSSSTPQTNFLTLATNGFVSNLLESDNVSSNIYSYVDAQLTPTTVSTNGATGTIALNNLPGRVELTAAKDLNLSLASVSGMNYLLLNSTNEFDTDGQSQFGAPYSDIYLGHTNGTMTITNLIKSSLPVWNGNIQAWTTEWFYTQTNGGIGGTNTIYYDFRVLLVSSQLNPATASSVEDFVLYSQDNVVISDVLNITRTFSLNCTNLLLTTNGPGNGAASLEGELNLNSTAINWPASVPRLSCLTNNGAITYENTVKFAGNSNYVTVTPGTNAAAATGTLSEAAGRTNVMVNNKVTIGTNVYSFVTKLTNTIPNQVKIAPKFDGTLSNLIAAINHAVGAGTNYTTNTTANPLVTAGLLNTNTHAFVVTAITAGAAGNSITSTNSTVTTNLTWNGHTTLYGGINSVAAVTNVSTVQVPYLDFVNSGSISGLGANIWANDFENYGYFTAGTGSFNVQSLATTMTNGTVFAAGTFSVTANNLVIGGTSIQSGKSFTLTATNLLTDTGVTNGNIWLIGTNYSGYGNWTGLVLPIKPAYGDLLGTTITNVAVTNALMNETWAGEDRGAVNAGFSNNVAIGQMVFDARSTAPHTGFYFSGTGVSNAIYVDSLILTDQSTNIDGGYNVTVFQFNTNLVIYYAQALLNGVSVAEKFNHKNGDHLRWVPTYTGYYSSTNLVYPPGVTNTVNTALAESSDIDSDGDGTPNSTDPTPFLVPAQVNFTETLTNVPPLSVQLQWQTVANATNNVYYKTNLLSPGWLLLTNFISPFPYPSPPGYVSVFDPLTNAPHYYQVVVQPNLLYGSQ